jgi:hypothetical protein
MMAMVRVGRVLIELPVANEPRPSFDQLLDVFDAVKVQIGPSPFAIEKLQGFLSPPLKGQGQQGMVHNPFGSFYRHPIGMDLDFVQVRLRFHIDVHIGRVLLDHHGGENPNAKIAGLVELLPDFAVAVDEDKTELKGFFFPGFQDQ